MIRISKIFNVQSRLILLSISTLLSVNSLANIEIQSLDSIRQTAEEFTLENLANADRDASVISSKLDPRLRLKACSNKLEAFFPEYGRRVGNITVGVRCIGEQSWSLFVPMTVKIYREIVTASRPLARGTMLTENDLQLERRNISAFSSDYFTDPHALFGQELVHSLQISRPLSSHNVKAPIAIKRGNLVVLLAKNETIEVRMEGKALADGTIGERIKVKNLRSNRIVEGVVKSNRIIVVQ